SVDLLGKMDPVVAHGKPKPIAFRPGHVKWNYPYSVGRLRPDLVTQLVAPTHGELCGMRTWGYDQIGPELFVRRDAPLPRRAELGQAVTALDVLSALPPC